MILCAVEVHLLTYLLELRGFSVLCLSCILVKDDIIAEN